MPCMQQGERESLQEYNQDASGEDVGEAVGWGAPSSRGGAASRLQRRTGSPGGSRAASSQAVCAHDWYFTVHTRVKRGDDILHYVGTSDVSHAEPLRSVNDRRLGSIRQIARSRRLHAQHPNMPFQHFHPTISNWIRYPHYGMRQRWIMYGDNH